MYFWQYADYLILKIFKSKWIRRDTFFPNSATGAIIPIYSTDEVILQSLSSSVSGRMILFIIIML